MVLIKSFVWGAAAAALAMTHAHAQLLRGSPDEHRLSPRERVMLSSVRDVCRGDVMRLCQPPPPTTSGMDLFHQVDAMMASFHQAMLQNSVPTVVYSLSTTTGDGYDDDKVEAVPTTMLDHHEAHHGGHVLIHHHHRRRLSEDPSDFSLPIGCGHMEKCLKEAYEKQQLSVSCRDAIDVYRRNHHVVVQKEKTGVVVPTSDWDASATAFALIYLCMFVTFMLIVKRHRRVMREQQRLKTRIMRALYSNVDVKAQVEKELGEDLGFVPPLERNALYSFGLHGAAYRKANRMVAKCLWNFVLLGCVLVVWAPQAALWMMLFAALYLLLTAIHYREPVRVCTCCCCGVSTTDVQNGNVSKLQACCSCCKGTGVCAPGCADCCGGDSDCCDNGCADGCCDGGGKKGCPDKPEPKGRGEKHRVKAQESVHDGVAVQIA